VARAYLDFLYTPAGQEIVAKHDFRPRDPVVLKKHAAKYPNIRTFTVEQKLGGWASGAEGALSLTARLYDQIVAKK
jgi:sulfate transport system substrate-binding protein